MATAKVGSHPVPHNHILRLAGTSCCGAPVYILAGCPRAYNSTINSRIQPKECNDDSTTDDQCEERCVFQSLNCNSSEPDTNSNVTDNTGIISDHYSRLNETADNPKPPNVFDDSTNFTKSNVAHTIMQRSPICAFRVNCTNSPCRSVLRAKCCCCPPKPGAMFGNGCCGSNVPRSPCTTASGGRPCLLCNSGNGLGGNNITSNINYIKGGNLLCCSGNGPGTNRIQSFINVISGDSSLVSSGDVTLLQSLCNLFIGQNFTLCGGSAYRKGNTEILKDTPDFQTAALTPNGET